jgi:hypothetical protein
MTEYEKTQDVQGLRLYCRSLTFEFILDTLLSSMIGQAFLMGLFIRFYLSYRGCHSVLRYRTSD